MDAITHSNQRRIQRKDVFIDKEYWKESANGSKLIFSTLGEKSLEPQWAGHNLHFYRQELFALL